MVPWEDLPPRLDVVLDWRKPWSVERFLEAAKLHGLLLWPVDVDRQREHLVLCVQFHLRSLEGGRLGTRSMTPAQREDLARRKQADKKYIVENVMNLRDLRGSLLWARDPSSYNFSLNERRKHWIYMSWLTDFSIRYHETAWMAKHKQLSQEIDDLFQNLKHPFSKELLITCKKELGYHEKDVVLERNIRDT
jgi:hypothetical protein